MENDSSKNRNQAWVPNLREELRKEIASLTDEQVEYVLRRLGEIKNKVA